MIDLRDVMTVQEVADTYGITRDTVHKAIQDDRIPARQSSKTWLIRREDAEARWGERNEDDSSQDW
jgi:excisionase family DNA binding protein